MPNHLAVVGRLCLQQMMTIGYFSLPVVGMTALFTGAALALQIYLASGHCDGARHHFF